MECQKYEQFFKNLMFSYRFLIKSSHFQSSSTKHSLFFPFFPLFLQPSAFFFLPFFLLSHYTKNHNPIAEVVIFVDVDQRRFSSTAEGKVNRHLICI